MADINKPNKRKGKGQPPIEVEPTRNLEKKSDSEVVNLNFKVPLSFKKEFKSYCSEIDMDMKQVLMMFYTKHRDELRK